MAGGPGLMDGGFVGAPSSGIYNPITGEWEVENIGVPPDIEVEQDPALVRQGHDPQLEKAVAVVMEELKKNAAAKASPPGFSELPPDGIAVVGASGIRLPVEDGYRGELQGNGRIRQRAA